MHPTKRQVLKSSMHLRYHLCELYPWTGLRAKGTPGLRCPQIYPSDTHTGVLAHPLPFWACSQSQALCMCLTCTTTTITSIDHVCT